MSTSKAIPQEAEFKAAVRKHLVEKYGTTSKAQQALQIPLRTVQRWFVGKLSRVIQEADSREKIELLIEILQIKMKFL